MIYDYTKGMIERASFSPDRFVREVRKAHKALLPHEIEKLNTWLLYFTEKKPELRDLIFISN
jgi:hypothetical protein